MFFPFCFFKWKICRIYLLFLANCVSFAVRCIFLLSSKVSSLRIDFERFELQICWYLFCLCVLYYLFVFQTWNHSWYNLLKLKLLHKENKFAGAGEFKETFFCCKLRHVLFASYQVPRFFVFFSSHSYGFRFLVYLKYSYFSIFYPCGILVFQL